MCDVQVYRHLASLLQDGFRIAEFLEVFCSSCMQMGREEKNGWGGEVLRTWGWNREAAFLGVLRWERPGGGVDGRDG